ncbi:MAG: signal peptidase I [Actinomycetota bacterium]|nr:signal peptidase I [Actinomycetota bacterium]
MTPEGVEGGATRFDPSPVATAEDAPAATGAAGFGERPRSFLRELPFLLAVALGLSLLLKAFVIQAFHIPSGSMESTLQVGDRVLVNKLVYDLRDIRRGEVVVFDGVDSFTAEVPGTPEQGALARARRAVGSTLGVASPDERDFIKRVIGVEGDRVRCCDERGRVSVNGEPLDESYVYPGDRPSEMKFDVRVPPGRLWVMGDHRSRSADSRVHLGDPGGGMVPVQRVIGRAFVVVWPVSDARWLPVPSTFERPGTESDAG